MLMIVIVRSRIWEMIQLTNFGFSGLTFKRYPVVSEIYLST